MRIIKMRFANDKSGNRVFIDEAKIGMQYYCPVCDEELITRMGTKRIHHFAHRKGTTCNDSWHYDMSEWHKNWQNRFPQECQEIVKEFNKKNTVPIYCWKIKKQLLNFNTAKSVIKNLQIETIFINHLDTK